MKIINRFEEYMKKRAIMNIIDKEIIKLYNERGLFIENRDVDEEKLVIYDVFKDYKFKDIKDYTKEEYEKITKDILYQVLDELEDTAEYYYRRTPKGKNKSWYNYHIRNLSIKLIKYFTNDK